MVLKTKQELHEQVDHLYRDLCRYTLKIEMVVDRQREVKGNSGSARIARESLPTNIYVTLADLLLAQHRVKNSIIKTLKKLIRPSSVVGVDKHTLSLTYRDDNGNRIPVPLVMAPGTPLTEGSLSGSILVADPEMMRKQPERHAPAYSIEVQDKGINNFISIYTGTSNVEVSTGYIHLLQQSVLLSLLTVYRTLKPEDVSIAVRTTVRKILDIIGAEDITDVPLACAPWITMAQMKGATSSAYRWLGDIQDTIPSAMIPYDEDTLWSAIENNIIYWALASLKVASIEATRYILNLTASRYPRVDVLNDVSDALLSTVVFGDNDIQRIVNVCTKHIAQLLQTRIRGRTKLPLKTRYQLNLAYDGTSLTMIDSARRAFHEGKAFVQISWGDGVIKHLRTVTLKIVDSTTSIQSLLTVNLDEQLGTVSVTPQYLVAAHLSAEQAPGTHILMITHDETGKPTALYKYKRMTPECIAHQTLPAYPILYPYNSLYNNLTIPCPDFEFPVLLETAISDIEQGLLDTAQTPRQKTNIALRLTANYLKLHVDEVRENIRRGLLRTVVVRYSRTPADWILSTLLLSAPGTREPFKILIQSKPHLERIMNSIFPHLPTREANYLMEMYQEISAKADQQFETTTGGVHAANTVP